MFKASLKCGTHTFNKTSPLNDFMRFLIIILLDCLLKVLVTIFALQVFFYCHIFYYQVDVPLMISLIKL